MIQQMVDFCIRWLIPNFYREEIERKERERLLSLLTDTASALRGAGIVDRSILLGLRIAADIVSPDSYTAIVNRKSLGDALRNEESKLRHEAIIPSANVYAPPKKKLDLAATQKRMPITVTKPKRKTRSSTAVKRVK